MEKKKKKKSKKTNTLLILCIPHRDVAPGVLRAPQRQKCEHKNLEQHFFLNFTQQFSANNCIYIYRSTFLLRVLPDSKMRVGPHPSAVPPVFLPNAIILSNTTAPSSLLCWIMCPGRAPKRLPNCESNQ